MRDVVNLSTYAYSISASFPAFAGFSPRGDDLPTAGHADQIACPVETAKLNSKEHLSNSSMWQFFSKRF